MTDFATGSAPMNSPEPGISGQFRELLASVASYFQARLQLLGIEFGEAGRHYVKLAAFAVAAIGAVLFGYIFLWIGLVFLLSHWTGWTWEWVLLAVAGAHFLGTLICAGIAWKMIATPIFTETLNEFKKDHEWLKSSKKPL